MDDDYIELTIDVFDTTGQQARVRKTLTLGGLTDEILREFDDLDRRTPEAYGLFMKGESRPLDRECKISDLDIQAHDTLEFKYARVSVRERLPGAEKAFLRDERTQNVFEIQWQPALIGRPDADPTHNELLAVNLETSPEGRRISRRHAQITYRDGRYYLESLSSYNPTFINNEKEPVTQKHALRSGDKIRIGKNMIVLTFSIGK